MTVGVMVVVAVTELHNKMLFLPTRNARYGSMTYIVGVTVMLDATVDGFGVDVVVCRSQRSFYLRLCWREASHMPLLK